MEARFLTKAELADRWQYSVRTIETFMAEGWLPYIKNPKGSVRFDAADCDKALKLRSGHRGNLGEP